MATIGAGPAAPPLLAPAARLDRLRDRPAACAEASDPLRRSRTRRSRTLLGASDGRTEIDRFWDVFVRPALNLPTPTRRAPTTGSSPSRRRSSRGRGASDLLLPIEPLGEMHGDAAGRALGGRRDVRLDARVESLDELDADA